jgi:hypothetical protein
MRALLECWHARGADGPSVCWICQPAMAHAVRVCLLAAPTCGVCHCGSAFGLLSLNAGEVVIARHSVCPFGLHKARARHTRLFAHMHVRSGVMSCQG